MKTIASLAKTTAIGGLVFLLPLVLLVAIVGKAFNIIKVVLTPLGNLISAEKVAGYAIADGRGSSKIILETPRLQRNV